MAVFEETGTRTVNLEKLYKLLLPLPPTFVEAERAFSSASLFITKLCTSLNDESVNILRFLRAHIKN